MGLNKTKGDLKKEDLGEITPRQAWDQFDLLSLKVIGITGTTFLRLYRQGFMDAEHPKVKRVWNIVPVKYETL